jgi:hypothetical protein
MGRERPLRSARFQQRGLKINLPPFSSSPFSIYGYRNSTAILSNGGMPGLLSPKAGQIDGFLITVRISLMHYNFLVHTTQSDMEAQIYVNTKKAPLHTPRLTQKFCIRQKQEEDQLH